MCTCFTLGGGDFVCPEMERIKKEIREKEGGKGDYIKDKCFKSSLRSEEESGMEIRLVLKLFEFKQNM